MSRPAAYLDHAAASPLDERVRAAMLPFLGEEFGSPSSLHEAGRGPAEAIERAREEVAALAGCEPGWVVFTSGATEARALAVAGLLRANRALGDRIALTAVEHPATLAACRAAERDGAALDRIPVDGLGAVAAADVAAVVGDDTALVCLVHGQPDIGTLQELPPLIAAARAARAEARVVVDAGETAGLVPLDAAALGADALVLGGGPVGAPPWTGALLVRPGARLHPLIGGGAQEGGKRAGAQDVPGIVALGTAARIAREEMAARAARCAALAERLTRGLLAVPGVRLNGHPDRRIPGHVQVSAGWVDGEALTLALATRGVAASPGSACSAAGKAAPALEAIGLEPPWTHSAVLFTLRATTTEQEVDRAVAAFADAVAALRAMSPVAPS
ncbi:cysteine desulfurase family protein [Miltoncostaea marina]|uniref:cysteine desulfurase family protein n=1 Tax=Miltoncostaea marina TaxID=2843215 RepID=UPI001C3CF1A0|nr:aminotransferase class V-fold PLP-dependent enzyme [Miltoncostaea marina]